MTGDTNESESQFDETVIHDSYYAKAVSNSQCSPNTLVKSVTLQNSYEKPVQAQWTSHLHTRLGTDSSEYQMEKEKERPLGRSPEQYSDLIKFNPSRRASIAEQVRADKKRNKNSKTNFKSFNAI